MSNATNPHRPAVDPEPATVAHRDHVRKPTATPSEAMGMIADGSSVAIAGFGVGHRFPVALITALGEADVADLCVICNSPGVPGVGSIDEVIRLGKVSRLIASFSARPGSTSSAEAAMAAGTLELELVSQGTLVERLRAGGTGIPAFYTKVSADTDISANKEVREFSGVNYVLETGLRPDFALIRAWRGDRAGNLVFRGGSRNFNDSFAKSARTTIVEVDEFLEVGEIPPEDVDLPGIFVDIIVPVDKHDVVTTSVPTLVRRPTDSAREHLGRRALSRQQMAMRAAALLPDNSYVNLGVGLPTLIARHVAGRGIVLHAENGILGYGPQLTADEADIDVYNAGGEYVALNEGASFFDSVTSFEIARSGRLDAVVLGAYEVDRQGNLANWSTTSMLGGGIGGAMDMVSSDAKLIAILEHRSSGGLAKLVESCTLPVTCRSKVDVIVTDLAVLSRNDHGFTLDEVAPGFEVDEVLALTGMALDVSPTVRVIDI